MVQRMNKKHYFELAKKCIKDLRPFTDNIDSVNTEKSSYCYKEIAGEDIDGYQLNNNERKLVVDIANRLLQELGEDGISIVHIHDILKKTHSFQIQADERKTLKAFARPRLILGHRKIDQFPAQLDDAAKALQQHYFDGCWKEEPRNNWSTEKVFRWRDNEGDKAAKEEKIQLMRQLLEGHNISSSPPLPDKKDGSEYFELTPEQLNQLRGAEKYPVTRPRYSRDPPAAGR